MSLTKQGARAAAQGLRRPRAAQKLRRYASSSHGAGHGAGHGESALHLKDANPSGNESLGKGFYYTLAAVPLFYVAYSLAYGSKDNFFARQYLAYKEGKKATADAEILHNVVLSQAVRDRARLASFPREVGGRELNYPEMFNAGSPWNLAAGQQTANLKDLEEHYKRLNAEAEQERAARSNGGKAASLYDS